MKIKSILFFLSFSIIFLSAQEGKMPVTKILDSVNSSKVDMLPADSILVKNYETENAVYPKNFTDKFQEKYRGKDFDYSTIKPHESLWQRIKRNIAKLFRKIFGDIDVMTANRYTINFLRFLGILALSFLLYFLIKYLMSKNGNFFFGKKNKKVAIKEGEIIESIHEINFPEIIAKFELKKDFRSAIRYRFLQVLKQLSDKNKILWMPEKTNKDYAVEFKDSSLKASFLELVYIFDYVWYGEFSISEGDYQYYKSKFQNTKL